jgi:lipopolysaccharide assembly protein A
MKKIFKQLLLILILVVILIFCIQNFNLLEIKFLDWGMNLPIFISLMLFYILGGISGGLFISLIKDATKASKSAEKDKSTE